MARSNRLTISRRHEPDLAAQVKALLRLLGSREAIETTGEDGNAKIERQANFKGGK